MTDRATPNLPSRHFDETQRFFAALGFSARWRDEDWMILERGDLLLEFFSAPGLDPLTSSFGCCLRLDDLDGFYATAKEATIPEARQGHPRLHPPERQAWGGRNAALIDPDGSLFRLISNGD